jgi:hypothetical protein
MFRAKPVMNALMVQLLVDPLPDKFKRDKIADQNKWRLFKLFIAFLSQRTKFRKQEYCLPQVVARQLYPLKISLSGFGTRYLARIFRKIQESARVAQEFKEGAFLWMPLSCAKRANSRDLSELPNAHAGRSTAFQQVLWKTKSPEPFYESEMRSAIIVVAPLRDP